MSLPADWRIVVTSTMPLNKTDKHPLDINMLSYIPKVEYERIAGLKSNSFERSSIFADMCRINTLYMISFAGSGHVGSSLSSLDIVSLLYLNHMQGVGTKNGDVYFSSKGHDAPGLYSVLIGLGLLPFEKLHQLRRLGGLPGHPDIDTPHIVTNTGSLGMGISKARGMAIADQHKGLNRNYYVLLGDGEMQEGQFWESLMPTSNRHMGRITAIVDHNKIQSDTFVSEVSDLGDIEKRVSACGWEVARVDGHDMSALKNTLDDLSRIDDRPKLVIADTVKAKGGGLMESTNFKSKDRLYKFHSGAPSAEFYVPAVDGLIDSVNDRLKTLGADPLKLEKVERPAAVKLAAPQKLIDAYSGELVNQAEKNESLFSLSADLALDTGLLEFEKQFPNRFIECGIAEQDMVSQAGGMALNGAFPVVHSFACFLASRPNEQIFNNATEKTRVMYVGSLAGVIPGGPGHSHQSIRDIAAMSAHPGLELLEPCCEDEVTMAVDYCVSRAKGSTYLRLVSIPVEINFSLPSGYMLETGRGIALTAGGDVVIIGYGPVMLSEAVKCSDILLKEGIKAKVVNLPWLNSIDNGWLEETVDGANLVITLDNHYVEGGQGERIAGCLAGKSVKVISIGVEGIAKCGRNQEVLKAHGLDGESIAQKARESLELAP